MKEKILIFQLLAFFFTACHWTDTPRSGKVIARVGEAYLYEDDVKKLLPPNYTLEDSVRIVTPFINHWALKKLLFAKAQDNLSNNKKEAFEQLVNEYRTDLYSQAYLDLLTRQVDTTITRTEKEKFYQENKDIFKLNENLVQLRYLEIPIGNISQKLISSFRNFSSKDKSYIDSLSTSFRSLFLNDSIWVRATDVEEKLPIMKDKLNKRFINQFLEQRDSTNVHLVKINNFLDSSDYAPIEYVSPTLKQIILNKRKSNYINNLEKEIITNAIKKKQFELYEEN